MITDERLREAFGEDEAQAVYREVKEKNAFVDFARRFAYSEDHRVARNALWSLTKASDEELAQMQGMLHELIDLAMSTESSSVRRLTLNIVERLRLGEEDLRTDFLDFCLAHMADVVELPGIQTLCMKLAYRMCGFYPELTGEFMCTLETMQIEFYKPAVKALRKKILGGKMKQGH